MTDGPMPVDGLASLWQELGRAGVAEPTSLDEAEERYLAVTTEVQRIQTQLSDRVRFDEDGHPLDYVEYGRWRERALRALRWKMFEQRALKLWVRRARNAFWEASATHRARKLGEALKRFGRHLERCHQGPCDCGLLAALALADEES